MIQAFLLLKNQSAKVSNDAAAIATGKSPSPFHAIKMPAIRASAPASGVAVASMIAGKVITASVT